MSSERSGCLLLFPLRVLTGAGRGVARLAGPSLPQIPFSRIDPEDHQALARSRAAAERALATLGSKSSELDPMVAGDVSAHVARLVEQLIAVAEEIARARKFVRLNDPKTLGKARAELEVRAWGSSATEKRALDEAMGSIAEREKHAATVAGEIGVLSARLLAGTAALDTLAAKIERAALTPDERSARVGKALTELDQERKDAERALEAFAATAREMARLAGS